MKKQSALALALMMVFALTACGGGGDSKSTTAAPAADDATTAAATEANAGVDSETTAAAAKADGEPMHIALITMDQIDVHCVKLEMAAMATVEELQEAGKNIEY